MPHPSLDNHTKLPPTGRHNTYIPNNLPFAIVCILLCLPLGIPALVFACEVDSLASLGHYDLAVKKSRQAKTLSLWGIGLVLGSVVFYFIIIIGFLIALQFNKGA